MHKFNEIAILSLLILFISGCHRNTNADNQIWKEGAPDIGEIQTIKVPSFAGLAETLKQTVVNISTTQVKKGGDQFHSWGREDRDPSEDFFNDDFFRRFFGAPPTPKEFKIQALGSGFIINESGYIITNNHIVEQASNIKAILENGDEYDAKVIGKDKKTDVALIKIEAHKKLKFALIGNSDELRVGDWVLAIGNPFGLNHSVSHGIVSAKGRDLHLGIYDDFIQTDASINPGNSGGPMINLKGQVIGINSAIIAGANSIGFAIPINLAKDIVKQLKEGGKVKRGWLGVSIQPIINEETKKAMGLANKNGALVADVFEDSPAAKAGIVRGDIIVKFDGREIKKYSDLTRFVSDTPVNKDVEIIIIRENKEITLKTKVAERRDEELVTSKNSEYGEILGIVVQNLTRDLAQSLGLSLSDGVVVVAVKEGSSAEEKGVVRGDVVQQIIIKGVQYNIKSVDDYMKVMKNVKKGDSVALWIKRQDSSIYIALTIE